MRVRCTAAKESGTCPDPRSFYLDTIEQAVIAGLGRELLRPEAVSAYVEEYVAERRRLASGHAAERVRLQRRLSAVETEAERCVDRLVKGIGDADRVGARSKALAAEEREIRRKLARAPRADQSPGGASGTS